MSIIRSTLCFRRERNTLSEKKGPYKYGKKQTIWAALWPYSSVKSGGRGVSFFSSCALKKIPLVCVFIKCSVSRWWWWCFRKKKTHKRLCVSFALFARCFFSRLFRISLSKRCRFYTYVTPLDETLAVLLETPKESTTTSPLAQRKSLRV